MIPIHHTLITHWLTYKLVSRKRRARAVSKATAFSLFLVLPLAFAVAVYLA